MAPSWTKSAGILPLPLPGTAISLPSRSSCRTRLGEVPRSWATSAGVSVSIGCEPMAPADPPPRCPARPTRRACTRRLRRRPADDPAFLDLAALEGSARGLLPPAVADYYAGGAEAETTLAEATPAWRAWRLRPARAARRPAVRLATSLLGSEVAHARSASRRGPTRRWRTPTASGAPPAGRPPRGADDRVHRRRAPRSPTSPPSSRTRRSGSSSTAGTPPPTPTTWPGAPGRPATAPWCSPSTCRCSDAGGCATCADRQSRCPPTCRWATPRPRRPTSPAPDWTFDDIGRFAELSGLPVVVKGVPARRRRRRCVQAGASARSGSPRTAAGRPTPWSPAPPPCPRSPTPSATRSRSTPTAGSARARTC